MNTVDRGRIRGWTAVSISVVLACLWAFWGGTENFHEGWYRDALLSNVALMVVQYLGPMLVFMGVALFSIYRPRLGAGLHLALALLAAWFFKAFSNAATFLVILPLIGLGALYWFGEPRPRTTAAALVIGLPLLTLIVSGIGPAIRVSQRLDDGNLQARTVQGNGVALTWAPAGPGWPRTGGNWYEGSRACRDLREDGQSVASVPQHAWRLPTADEAVRSMARHGNNSGGEWNAENAAATYQTTPDKESPLWNVHSPVIYWWTATEVDEERAYIVVYDGKVLPRSKEFGPAYLGFRCVK